MLRAAHASHTGSLYLVDVDPPAGIIELVRDTHLETCTAQQRIVFWFTRSTNQAFMFPNAMATELLLCTTRFTAHDVPILRGNVVITAVDATGRPAALTNHQIHQLTHSALSKREQRIITHRFYRDARTQRRRALAEHATHRDTRLPWPGR